MKTLLLLAFFATSTAFAQNSGTSAPISTGRVTAVDPEAGTMTLYSDQRRARINYYNMTRARIETASGKAIGFRMVQPEMPATVYYAMMGKQWYVSKVVVADPPRMQPMVEPTRFQLKALNSRAARDRDITTQPGSKARLDNDITTQPGKKDAMDRDITRQPGNF